MHHESGVGPVASTIRKTGVFSLSVFHPNWKVFCPRRGSISQSCSTEETPLMALSASARARKKARGFRSKRSSADIVTRNLTNNQQCKVSRRVGIPVVGSIFILLCVAQCRFKDQAALTSVVPVEMKADILYRLVPARPLGPLFHIPGRPNNCLCDAQKFLQ